MNNYLNTQEEQYVLSHLNESIELLMKIGQIPAPSYQELERARFCKKWLEDQGAEGVYIDEVYNVIYPVNLQDNKEIVVFMAHSDIAFQDTEKIKMMQKDHYLYGAGIGDDTANVVHLLMTVKYIIEHQLNPSSGILFVIDACEEGLGNSRGCQAIFQKYKKQIKAMISFDGYLNECTNCAVGSRRYEIKITGEGGHSYADFGHLNAISQMARLICDLDHIELPQEAKTTYNFGVIKGGTTINAIASQASLLYEFRSSKQSCLEAMEEKMRSVLKKYPDIQIKTLGIRPGNGNIDKNRLDEFTQENLDIIKHYYHNEVRLCANSTDANIPLSYGILANTVGTIIGGNAHTYQEWIDLDSIEPGLKSAMALVLRYFR